MVPQEGEQASQSVNSPNQYRSGVDSNGEDFVVLCSSFEKCDGLFYTVFIIQANLQSVSHFL